MNLSPEIVRQMQTGNMQMAQMNAIRISVAGQIYAELIGVEFAMQQSRAVANDDPLGIKPDDEPRHVEIKIDCRQPANLAMHASAVFVQALQGKGPT